MDLKKIISGMRTGNHQALAKAITLIENKSPSQKKIALQLLKESSALDHDSIRIAVSGPPGVGKSSFIEEFGLYLIEQQQKKVAVLAIDPTSPLSGGSILGDKTRMTELAKHDRAFIRPSPGGKNVSGVTQTTPDAILLCEAAGFNIIVVETIGVGQSEIEVVMMTDLLILLQQPFAGDQLQGLKKGILELADIIVVTKNDGHTKNGALQTKLDLQQALHFSTTKSDQQTPVVLTSALEKTGFDEVWQHIKRIIDARKHRKEFYDTRHQQWQYWYRQQIKTLLIDNIMNLDRIKRLMMIDKKKFVRDQQSTSVVAFETVNKILAVLKIRKS